MDQSIVSKGANVQDAISFGLEILGASRDQVSIEVIQRESKSLFRLKPAIVKLTKNNSSSDRAMRFPEQTQSVSAEKLIDDIDLDSFLDKDLNLDQLSSQYVKSKGIHDKEDAEGKVWVKDGKIFGQPSPLQYPTVTVGKGIKLFKNNELIQGTTVVAENDSFIIEEEAESKETKWNVEMDSQKLNVTLKVEPGAKITRKVKDVEPDFSIVLEAEEHIEIRNELTYQEVIDKLDALHVFQGFNHQEIMKAVESQEVQEFIIACGSMPKEGKDGYVEFKIENENKSDGPMERTNGTVDYREIKYIPAVNKGQVIGIIHPPIPGIPGKSVTNEPILPKQTFPVIIQPGTGILVVDEKIIATETGRPSVEQKKQSIKISIMQKLVHQGDVNIATGNIRFKGDVDILGNVEESMVVEADGIITVSKNVNMASVTSKNSILIHRNIIGSNISAGKNNLFVSELVHLLSMIQESHKGLIQAINQLINVPAFKLTDYQKGGLLPLIKLLLERKFRSLPSLIKQYIELCQQGKNLLDNQWLVLAEQFRLCFLSSIPNQWHKMDELQTLLKIINTLIDEYQQDKDEFCSVQLLYSLNSNIYCSGDVLINGQGCYNSKIHSGGELKINGILRGGEVYARLGAFIKEVGSEVGVPTRVIVPVDKKIRIDLAREGTIIKIGKVIYKFDREQRYVEASLDQEGKIVFK
jgi:uncharacterized protein (DUF342 family)